MSDPPSTLPTVAGDSVTFRLDGELTIDKVADAFSRFRAVLDALEQDQEANVRWVLAGLDYGSAGITARAEPLDDDAVAKIPLMTERYLDAGRQVKILRRLDDSLGATALKGPSIRTVPTCGKNVKPGVGPVWIVSRMKC